jgi:hypothetical protein
MTMHFEGEGRPRGRVFPATILGAVDDAVNSTLLKSISNQPAGSAMPSESSGGPASTAADDDSAD